MSGYMTESEARYDLEVFVRGVLVGHRRRQ